MWLWWLLGILVAGFVVFIIYEIRESVERIEDKLDEMHVALSKLADKQRPLDASPDTSSKDVE